MIDGQLASPEKRRFMGDEKARAFAMPWRTDAVVRGRAVTAGRAADSTDGVHYTDVSAQPPL